MAVSLLQPLGAIPLAVVDVETTGASAHYGDRVTEIGIVRLESGSVTGTYQQLVNPQRRISAGVVALTGISNDMVADQPLFAQQWPAMRPYLEGALIVGHNIPFDLGFLRAEMGRIGLGLAEVAGTTQALDTVRIARRRFGRGGNGLSRLAGRLGVMVTTAHRALADAITTAQVLERLIEPVGGWNLKLCDAILQQGGPLSINPPAKRESILPLELQEALDADQSIILEYLDAHRHRTERLIKPLEVRRFKGELVLIAHCHLRNDRRNFKLERIVTLRRQESAPPTPATRIEQPLLWSQG